MDPAEDRTTSPNDETEAIRKALGTLMELIVRENERLHGEMQATRKETIFVIDKIMDMHNSNLKDFEKKLEAKLRGMANRLSCAEKSIDDVRKNVKTITEEGVISVDTRTISKQQQTILHHEGLFSKHKEAIQKVYLHLKSVEDKVELISRKEEIRHDLYGNSSIEGESVREPLSVIQLKVEQMKKDIEDLQSSTESILVMNSADLRHLDGQKQKENVFYEDEKTIHFESVLKSIKETVSQLKMNMEGLTARQAEDIELMYKTIESSSHHHKRQQQRHDSITNKLLKTDASYEAALKDMQKHIPDMLNNN